ncbi:hypothetical protein CsSME_00046885 [Camellia sinensis var. sinensis]
MIDFSAFHYFFFFVFVFVLVAYEANSKYLQHAGVGEKTPKTFVKDLGGFGVESRIPNEMQVFWPRGFPILVLPPPFITNSVLFYLHFKFYFIFLWDHTFFFFPLLFFR